WRGPGRHRKRGEAVPIRNAPGGVASLRLTQNIAADRSGHLGTVAAPDPAVLDYSHTDVTRRLNRCEADEQRMVALLPGDLADLAQPVLVLVLADRPHLRSARLAAHGETGIGESLGVGRAALL